MSALRRALDGWALFEGIQPPCRISGLMGPSRSLVAAALALETEGPVLVVVCDERRLQPAVSDLGAFLRALDDDREVIPLPAFALDPYRGLSPHLEVVSARISALVALAARQRVAVVAPAAALLYRTASPDLIRQRVLTIRPGERFEPLTLERWLADSGYRREDPVTTPGDFARRGGVLDLFSPDSPEPYRLEFLDDEIEEIRAFDPGTQRTTRTLDEARILPGSEWPTGGEVRAELATLLGDGMEVEQALSRPGVGPLLARLETFHASVLDYLGEGLLIVEEPSATARGAEVEWERVLKSYDNAMGETVSMLAPPARLLVDLGELTSQLDARAVSLAEMGLFHEETHHLSTQILPSFRGRLPDFVEEVRRRVERYGRARVFVPNDAVADRSVQLFHEAGLSAGREPAGHVVLELGSLSQSFVVPELDLAVFTTADVFTEPPRAAPRRRKRLAQFLSDFRDLKIGDFVVHTEHGIGVFAGLTKLEEGGSTELVVLEYQGGDKLYVPVERLDLLEKYSSSEGKKPRVDTLGGTGWARVKKRVRKSMRDMAQELLRLYAARKSSPGHAFSSDDGWMREFEHLFEFEETPDQLQAIEEIKRDMEGPSPMDRLLCGDVGYGKTEVAMRAAFKAVSDGKQVAVLVPTTVLAFQHMTTFSERFAAFPVKVAMLSRFKSRTEQKQIVADLAEGKIDVIIGTHRLLSKDVRFADLGLLVIDEEQRFGVAHKERLKKLREGIDSLAMTATPIPRTLHMSLSGIRDLSVIETPPKDRMAIQTHITRLDSTVIAEALRYELGRGGQVYFVHNRVGSIYATANYILRLVPEARVAVAHGQMREAELERVMMRFINQEFDVLVSTTIIENGLDIPLVNTLIVNRADRFGLSQLYQLRGRVGRSNRRAYAYLLIPDEGRLTPIARRRLAAIREFSELGAGFRIAALDLELRGAGNLLGGEQHGHIEAVGFDLYCRLLDETVRELEGVEPPRVHRASLNLKLELRVPEAYVADANQRMSIYKRTSSAENEEALGRIEEETRDRFGALPAPVSQFFEFARLSLLADELGLEGVERERGRLTFRLGGDLVRAAAALEGGSLRVDGNQALLRLPFSGTGPEEILGAVRDVLIRLRRYSKMT
ncbi:MAG TPA: transcription-repair coupling factor [Vicinamibacteria bacterium]|nr:transcription-repair coupling factor [Vicinamibacteria bacterium]